MNTDHDSAAGSGRDPVECELCLQCLVENEPGGGFCRDCGAPLTAYASTGPFERLFAEGSLYRRAAEQPHRPIVVLGIWILFLPMALAGLAMTVGGMKEGERLTAMIGGFMSAVGLTMVVKTTINYLRRRNRGRSMTG